MPGIDTHIRLMLRRYETQLLAARRLARLRAVQRMQEPSALDMQARRAAVVEQVARELYERILFTGGENSMVETIRERLGERVGGAVRFSYPPGEAQLALVRESAHEQEPIREKDATILHGEERERALRALWRITVGTVDESMV